MTGPDAHDVMVAYREALQFADESRPGQPWWTQLEHAANHAAYVAARLVAFASGDDNPRTSQRLVSRAMAYGVAYTQLSAAELAARSSKLGSAS